MARRTLALLAAIPPALLAAVPTGASEAPRIETIAGSLGAGPGTEVSVHPLGVAAAGGTLFVSDGFANVVRRVDLASGFADVVAGVGVAGFDGDGGPATGAMLAAPGGLATAPGGALYVADQGNNRVRRVDPSGTIATVAGNGTRGFSGDGGPATQASLNQPFGLAVGSDGSLYIADQGNERVRRVDPAGTITTVAGNGVRGSLGDGLPASLAQLAQPTDVAVGPDGAVYIADSFNHKIRRVDPELGIITTIAGRGTAGDSGDGGPALLAELRYPVGVAVDASGNVHVADLLNHRIRVVRPGAPLATIETVAGGGYPDVGDGGPATQARLNLPQDVALDEAGAVYIADLAHARARRVDPPGPGPRLISTVLGNGRRSHSGDGGPAVEAQLDFPVAVAIGPDGSVFIAEDTGGVVRRVDPEGAITTYAGTGAIGFSGDGGPAVEATFAAPVSLASDPDGNLFVADFGNNRIRRIDADGTITTVAGSGAFGDTGDGGPATGAALASPAGVAVGADGSLYIADYGNNRVRKVSPEGTIAAFAGTGQRGSGGDGGPAVAATLRDPVAVAVDGAGNVYIADRGNNRVRRVDAAGIITTVAGTGQDAFSGDGGPAVEAALNYPSGLAVDAAGNLYITDTGNVRVRVVDPSGTISTYAGTGVVGYEGDGEPATAARLASPTGPAVTAEGDLLFAETGANRVRAVLRPRPEP